MRPLLLALAAVLLSACASTPVTFGGPTEADGVEFGVEGVIRAYGRVVAVEGYAHNASDVDFDRVLVVYELLDAAGIKVGDAAAEALGLAAGRTWRFDAPAAVKLRAAVKRVRIERIELEPHAGD